MGYELEVPTTEHYAVTADLRVLERSWQDAQGRLREALARMRHLKGLVETDDPLWWAAQIRVAEARQRCRVATDALAELTLDAL
jgi:hypothetical protein